MLLRTCIGLCVIWLVGCGSEAAPQVPVTHVPTPRPSVERLSKSTPVEKVVIGVEAQRSGHSLIVRVRGMGRGHSSDGPMENPDLWKVTASYGKSPLRQVLAGPAKVSRDPAGAAMGDQWNVEVNFLVAFALPDRAGVVEIAVQAPGGEHMTHQLTIEAPSEPLSQR